MARFEASDPPGRRASSFAIQVAERFRYLGDAIGEYEITFTKTRHARNMLKLQERDMREGVL
jgi:hypothetical protein